MSARRVPLGVLASGRGSNLQAILDASAAGRLDADVRVVVSDVPNAYALERARTAGIPAVTVDPRGLGGREAYERRVVAALEEHGVELVALAGYMRIVGPTLLAAFPLRIMNIHPSLLPSFPGLHVQRKAIAHGARFSGCTVHFVDAGVDTGPIIIQAVVPVLDADHEDALAERILRQEHRVFPRAIQLYAEGRLRVEGRRVVIDPPAGSGGDEALVNPPLDA